MPQVLKPLCLIYFLVNQIFSFSPLLGNKKWELRYKDEEVGNILEPNQLNKLQMVQFGIWMPQVVKPLCLIHFWVNLGGDRRSSPFWKESAKQVVPMVERICNILSWFFIIIFPTCCFHTGCLQQFPFLFTFERKEGGNRSSYSILRVDDPGAFKLDHLQPIVLIFENNLSNFFTFILGVCSISLFLILGREEERREKELIQKASVPQTIQNFKLDHLQPTEMIFENCFYNVLSKLFPSSRDTLLVLSAKQFRKFTDIIASTTFRKTSH